MLREVRWRMVDRQGTRAGPLALVLMLALVLPACRQVEPSGEGSRMRWELPPTDAAKVESWVSMCWSGRFEDVESVAADAKGAPPASLLAFLDSYDPLADPGECLGGLSLCTVIVTTNLPQSKLGRRDIRMAILETDRLIAKWEAYASNPRLSSYKENVDYIVYYLRLFRRKLTTGEPIPAECGE